MSKIGRKPINTKDVQIDIKGHEIHFKGKKASGVYVLPLELNVSKTDDSLALTSDTRSSEMNRIWGLHRALLANRILGPNKGLMKKLLLMVWVLKLRSLAISWFSLWGIVIKLI